MTKTVTKTQAIRWLKNVIRSLENRNDKGELLYIGVELDILQAVLGYIRDIPAKKKGK